MRTRSRACLLLVLLGTTAGCNRRLDLFTDGARLADRGNVDAGRPDLRPDRQTADLDPARPLRVEWVKVFGGATTKTYVGEEIALDTEGNIYFSALLFGKAQIGRDSVGRDDELMQVLVKLDPKGEPLWARQAGPLDMRNSGGVLVGPPFHMGSKLDSATGSTYLAGTFSQPVTLDKTLTSAGKKDIYLAKLDRDGNWLWSTTAGGPEDDVVHDITLAVDGPVIVGDFQGTTKFGSLVRTSRGGSDIFVAEADYGSGAWFRALTAGSSEPSLAGPPTPLNLPVNAETAYGVAFAGTDGYTLFVSGRVIGESGFTPAAGAPITLPLCRFLAKVQLPAWKWVVPTDGQWFSILPDRSSTLVFTAGGSSFAGYDGQTGGVKWRANAISSTASDLGGLAQDSAGNLYAGGSFEGTIVLTEDGKHTINAAGTRAAYLIKIDVKAGKILWSKPVNSPKYADIRKLAAGPGGTVYATGTFSGQVTVDGQTFTGDGTTASAFVMKLVP